MPTALHDADGKTLTFYFDDNLPVGTFAVLDVATWQYAHLPLSVLVGPDAPDPED